MLRQHLAGRALALARSLVPSSACSPAALAGRAAPALPSGCRGFSAGGADELRAPASPGADLRQTVERRLTADATAAARRSTPAEASTSAAAAAPARRFATGAAATAAAAVAPRPAVASPAVSAAPAGAPEEPPRLHPLRLFYPGQTYKPEDLDVDAADSAAFVHRPSQKTRQLHKRGQAANAELYAGADFRNGRLLSAFISEAGKLLPRRTNKVDAKVQRAIVRAVKTARMMAILPYTERLPAFTRGRKNPYV